MEKNRAFRHVDALQKLIATDGTSTLTKKLNPLGKKLTPIAKYLMKIGTMLETQREVYEAEIEYLKDRLHRPKAQCFD